MIRTVSPWRKSSGTAKASQVAAPSSTIASAHTTGVSGLVKRRKRSGLARPNIGLRLRVGNEPGKRAARRITKA